jgi:hypothetical protein
MPAVPSPSLLPSLLAFGAWLAATLGAGCALPRKDNPATCFDAGGCGNGQMCDLSSNQCVEVDAAMADTLGPDGGAVSGDGAAGTGGLGNPAGQGGQGGLLGPGGQSGIGGGGTTAATAGGAGGPGGFGATGGGLGGIGGGLGGMPATGGAPGSCLTPADCPAAKPFCPAKLCVACSDALCASMSQMQPVCGADLLLNTCQECNASAQCASKAATPVCADGKCVACTASSDCNAATTPICNNPTPHTCGPCTDNSGCKDKSTSAPVCLSTGACAECGLDADCTGAGKLACSAAKTCVECTRSATCPAPAPICDTKLTNTCGKCAADADCKDKDTKLPVCLTSAGTCVQCKANSDCGGTTPGCSAANVCVPCTDDSHCSGATPICDTTANKCIACTSDAQCAGKTSLGANPGVCMSHLDGHCALDTETLYVENKPAPGCSDTGNMAGTRALPFCSMQGAVAGLASGKLILVREGVQGASAPLAVAKVSVIGQNGALVAGGISPGIQLTSGSAYLRDLKLSSSANLGIAAGSGTTLRTQNLSVTASRGGISLDGAAFDLENTNVSGNFPSVDLTFSGIAIHNPPAAGPAKLNHLTVQGNMAVGIVCSGSGITMIQGTGVYASGNLVGDITPVCGFASCALVGATCGSTVVP